MFFIILPDGSCIPATRQATGVVMRQARSDARKAARIRRQEKAAQLQSSLEDRAVTSRLLKELAEADRSIAKWHRFQVRSMPERPAKATSPVIKRSAGPSSSAPRERGAARPQAASSWVIDRAGFRGVIWQQSYLGRNSQGFYRGAARDNWEYECRDEAVLRDATGEPVIISNMGEDWVEIGTAWQCLEDASTRKNAKVQIRVIAPFDADMSQEEMIAALRQFCSTVLEPMGLPYSAVIHEPSEEGDARNFHPHISMSLRPMRRIEPYAWEIADEVRGELDGRDGVQMLRHLWAHSMTEAAEAAGRNMQYTGLGYGARGIDFEAGEHLGEARNAMVRRGQHVAVHERNRIKAERNRLRARIRDLDSKITALTTIRDSVLKDRVGSIRAPSVGKIVSVDARDQQRRALTPAPSVDSRAQLVMSPVAPPSVYRVAAGERPAVKTLIAGGRHETAPPPKLVVFGPSPVPVQRLVASAVQTSETRTSPLTSPPVQQPRDHLTVQPMPARPHLTHAVTKRTPDPVIAIGRDLLEALRQQREAQEAHSAMDIASDASQPSTTDTRAEPKPAAVADASRPSPSLSLPIPASARRRLRRKAQRYKHGRSETRPLPTREWHEDHPHAAFDRQAERTVEQDQRLIARVTEMDIYIGIGSTGLRLNKWALAALDVDKAWLARPHVQRELGRIRAHQQGVLADIDATYGLGTAGNLAFPATLPRPLQDRLERWSDDDGLLEDLRRERKRDRIDGAVAKREARPDNPLGPETVSSTARPSGVER
jgi:hypothetical protein